MQKRNLHHHISTKNKQPSKPPQKLLRLIYPYIPHIIQKDQTNDTWVLYQTVTHPELTIDGPRYLYPEEQAFYQTHHQRLHGNITLVPLILSQIPDNQENPLKGVNVALEID